MPLNARKAYSYQVTVSRLSTGAKIYLVIWCGNTIVNVDQVIEIDMLMSAYLITYKSVLRAYCEGTVPVTIQYTDGATLEDVIQRLLVVSLPAFKVRLASYVKDQT